MHRGVATHNKQQKKKLHDGTAKVMQQDRAMWSAISGRSGLVKLMMMITVAASEMRPSCGQITKFHDPGVEARACTDDKICNLQV